MIFPSTHNHLKLGLGGAPLGNLFSAISEDAAQAVLKNALSDGCQTFDTAPHYGNGLSEHRFGHALRGVPRNNFVLSTKVGRLLHPDVHAPNEQHSFVNTLPYTQRWDFSAAAIRRSIEDSLQRLGLARIDVVFVHDCDATTHGNQYPQVLHQVVHEALPELRRMQSEGLLNHIGLGVNDVQVCLDVLQQTDLDCLLLAGRYSLIDHSGLPELLPLCAKKNIRMALGGVFNSGILATGVKAHTAGQTIRFNYAPAAPVWVKKVAEIETVCEQFNVPLRAAALQFPLAHPAIDVVMSGAQTTAQWQDALTMMAHPIPAQFWQALHGKNLLPPHAPTPG
jgi:D-threo-aldose 1-dehydrogenase